MASIAITFTHPAMNYTRTLNLPDADMVRLAACYKKLYATPQKPVLTNVEAITILTNDFRAKMMSDLQAYEQELARQTVVLADIT